eukprot:43737-Chlamydomonas_euryale.AAC.1
MNEHGHCHTGCALFSPQEVVGDRPMASVASDRHADCRRLVGGLLLLGRRVLYRPALLANARAPDTPHARAWCGTFSAASKVLQGARRLLRHV